MRRCDFCSGRFGLVSYRFFGKRFCRKRCRRDYVAAQLQKMRSKIVSRGVVWPRRVVMNTGGRIGCNSINRNGANP
jgi:hypothetical protein